MLLAERRTPLRRSVALLVELCDDYSISLKAAQGLLTACCGDVIADLSTIGCHAAVAKLHKRCHQLAFNDPDDLAPGCRPAPGLEEAINVH